MRYDGQAAQRGVVVQLVRIPACHAGGRGFESRPLRQQLRALPRKGPFLFGASARSSMILTSMFEKSSTKIRNRRSTAVAIAFGYM